VIFYRTIDALTSVIIDIDADYELCQMKAPYICVLTFALLSSFFAKPVPTMCVSSTVASTPVVITLGSIERAFMCSRIALETLTAASTMLSATSAASSAARHE
jgi:hypothetical protein